jgi:CCR4-NOT transcription complex subunit 4
MNLHEWGDEKDCFTKEDLTTLYVVVDGFILGFAFTRLFDHRKHTMKDTESRSRVIKKADDSEGRISSLIHSVSKG